jgi:hypothetical protein
MRKNQKLFSCPTCGCRNIRLTKKGNLAAHLKGGCGTVDCYRRKP